MTQGKELRSERRQRELSTVTVAKAAGFSRTKLWTIERAAEVSADDAAAIRAAIARLTAEKAA
jgi:predicted transcriptional regulator